MSEFEEDDGFIASDRTDTASSRGRKRKNMKNLRYKVWNDFDRYEYADGTKEAQCLICKESFTGSSSSGTSHLNNHRIRCQKKQNIRAEEVPTHVFSQIESRKDLASMIILHEYPLSIVDHVGFRKFVAGLNHEFKFVSRNTMKKDIIKIYDVEKEKTSKLLETVGRVAITTDMWSANTTKKGFMAVTAHFIDEKWELQNRILTFVYVPVPHSSVTLSRVLIESLFFWKIERKISAITVDNATTNDAMIEIVLDTLPRSHFLLNGTLLHMRCCAHILNLIVKDGLMIIGAKIDRIRSSCIFWTSTQTRIETFQSVAEQLHIPTSKGLELDVKTRWNSTYHMLKSALLFKDVFPILKIRQKNYDSLPPEEDWVLAKELCEKLELFNVVTNIFSGTTYPTANHYFPQICSVKLELIKWMSSTSEDIRNMANNMIEKCEKYWKECHLMMGIACVLDPRYKMKLVEFYFRQIYGDKSDEQIEKIRQGCYDLFAEYKSRLDVTENSTVGFASEGVSLNDSLASFDRYVGGSNTSSACELDLYLRENVVSRKFELDVVKWWGLQKGFPILQNMVKDIFAVQVSTVASESTFSSSGRLLSPHRSRLHNSTIEALMCARSWLSSDLKDSNSSVNTNIATVIDEEEEPLEDAEVQSRV